jgi:hypothetical protein
MSLSDPAAYERLRAETAEMLGLGVTDLSLVQGLQLDLVSLLRLEVDGLAGQVLAGKVVDLTRLATAVGMLQKLLPERALVSAPAAETTNPDAREKLRVLLEAGDAAEDERWAAMCAAEEVIQAAEAFGGVEQPAAPPAGPIVAPAAAASVPVPAQWGGVPRSWLKENQPDDRGWSAIGDGNVVPLRISPRDWGPI